MNLLKEKIRLGTAGWSIPKTYAEHFSNVGSHLVRYSQKLSAVEINSSFYRPHKAATYARWAEDVPEDFQFSIKIPKQMTHIERLMTTRSEMREFLSGPVCLGEKLGPLLVQLPPSLRFDPKGAGTFFDNLRAEFGGKVICEPRHSTWFAEAADRLLLNADVGRVAADPLPHAKAGNPGGSQKIIYFRLHGSPEMYYSAYPEAYLDHLMSRLNFFASSAAVTEVWCIFDNTALGHALGNALQLWKRIDANLTAVEKPMAPRLSKDVEESLESTRL